MSRVKDEAEYPTECPICGYASLDEYYCTECQGSKVVPPEEKEGVDGNERLNEGFGDFYEQEESPRQDGDENFSFQSNSDELSPSQLQVEVQYSPQFGEVPRDADPNSYVDGLGDDCDLGGC